MTIKFYYTVDSDSIRQFMPAGYAYMLPASSWSRHNLRAPRLPEQVTDVAADCGGFVATFKWGDYKYSPVSYVDWLETFRPAWAATMDYCCEDEITSGRPGIVIERQQRTSEMAYHFWKEYRDASWVWTPTIQGWTPNDYRRHAADLRPLLMEMKRHYADREFRIGIGTLCRRALAEDVVKVIHAVREILDFPIHLWGVKLTVLKRNIHLPNVISVDSAAWKPGGLGKDGHQANEERAVMGLSQREYDYQVALPRYAERVRRALAKPKQGVLGI
jgi:hypothetical protein